MYTIHNSLTGNIFLGYSAKGLTLIFQCSVNQSLKGNGKHAVILTEVSGIDRVE